jgi:hypothetical protein
MLMYFCYVAVDRSHLVTFFVIRNHLKNGYHIKKSRECYGFPSLSNSVDYVTSGLLANIILNNWVKFCYLATDQNSIQIEI